MLNLETLIMISGVIHLGTLIGSAQCHANCGLKKTPPKLNPLAAALGTGRCGYIVFNIVAFGVISLVFHKELAAQSVMARVFCGYVSLFWAIRLVIQLFFFNAKPYLRNAFLKIGYHGLTLVFVWQTVVYAWAAFGG